MTKRKKLSKEAKAIYLDETMRELDKLSEACRELGLTVLADKLQHVQNPLMAVRDDVDY